MLINKLLRQFECQCTQLSRIERLNLELERTKLFIQAVDPLLQENLNFYGKIAMKKEDWK